MNWFGFDWLSEWVSDEWVIEWEAIHLSIYELKMMDVWIDGWMDGFIFNLKWLYMGNCHYTNSPWVISHMIAHISSTHISSTIHEKHFYQICHCKHSQFSRWHPKFSHSSKTSDQITEQKIIIYYANANNLHVKRIIEILYMTGYQGWINWN